MAEDSLQAAGEVACLLDQLGVPYMVGGSVASTFWGRPRLTLNVDIVAALTADRARPFVEGLGEAWYSSLDAALNAIERRSSFNVIRHRGAVKIDVFVPPDEGLHASKWGRARRVEVDPASGLSLVLTSAEDILLQKLDWYRRAGEVSENQWGDVTELLRIAAGSLDEAYLDEWAARMDLVELLERARAASR